MKYIDPLLGVAIALYLIRGAYKVGRASFDNLMDREIEAEKIEKIEEIIKSHNKVTALTMLRTRYSGTTPIIQFDFTMDGNATLTEAHDVAHEIEEILLAEFPNAQIYMHQEPDGD